MPDDKSIFSDDWRLTERQWSMICDRTKKLSKKEASLVIKLIEAVFNNRSSELKKDNGFT